MAGCGLPRNQRADAQARQQHHFRGQRRRPPPQRDVAPGLGVVARRAQRRQADFADLEDLLRLRHALEAPAPVGLPQQVLAAFAQLARGAVGQRFGHRRQQDLPRPGQGHQARGHRLGQAFDFQRLGPDLHRRVAVLPGQHLAHVQAGARQQLHVAGLAQVAQAAGVIQGEAEAVDRPLEQQQQAIGTVDQAPAPLLLQLQHQLVVFAEQFGGGGVAQAFDQPGRIDQVGQQQGAQLRTFGRSADEIVHPGPPPAAQSCHSTRLPPTLLARYSAWSACAYQSFHSRAGSTRQAPTLSVVISGGVGCICCSASAVLTTKSA